MDVWENTGKNAHYHPRLAPLCCVYSPVFLSLFTANAHPTPPPSQKILECWGKLREKKRRNQLDGDRQRFCRFYPLTCVIGHTQSFFHAFYIFKTEINTNEKKQIEMAKRHAMYHCLWGAILKLALFSDPCPPSKQREKFLTVVPQCIGDILLHLSLCILLFAYMVFTPPGLQTTQNQDIYDMYCV